MKDLQERIFITKRNLPFLAVVISILAGFLILSFVSCSKISPAANTTPNFDFNKKTIVIGSDTTYPPFEYIEKGETLGFDIDIIKEIAARLGKSIEIKKIAWNPEYKELIDGKIDMIISAVPETVESNVVDFSKSYYTLEYLLISLSESEIKIREDLANKKIGILKIDKDKISEEYLKNYKLNFYEDIMEMLQALKSKEIEAILIASPMGVSLLRENKDMYIVMDKVAANKNFVMVFNKGSILREKVNNAIDQIKADGTYQKIYDKWFNYNS